MSESWYEIVEARVPLTQGDIIDRCPLLTWNPEIDTKVADSFSTAGLTDLITAYRDDVIVITQSCDLEHQKITNVVLCPHIPISRFRQLWEDAMKSGGQTPSEKAWRRTCLDIAGGHVWNQTFLNRFEHPELGNEIRVVEFRDLFTVPRTFLESMLQSRGQRRLRLLPPYREHLSQSFARFFMRVGLPQPVELPT